MRTRREGEGGAIAVVASVVLLVVGAFMALALNVGFVMNTKGQLQNGSDSAALAAAGSLDGTVAGVWRAQQMAVDYANAHSVTGQAVEITPSADVIFGRWDFPTRTFNPILDPFADPIMVDAVRVLDGRDDSGNHNGPLQVFFSNWLGRDTVNVTTAAVAVSRGARADCPMPFVLSHCDVQQGGSINCGNGGATQITLRMAAAGVDNVGFIFFLPGGTGNSDVPRNVLERCSGEATASEYPITNGRDFNDSVIQAMLGMVDPQGLGNTVMPYAPPGFPLWPDGSSSLCVFNNQNQSFPIAKMPSCPPNFTGNVTIAQYARIQMLRMTDQNGRIYTSCPTGPIHNWNNYTKSLPTGSDTRTMTVSVICDANNGLDNSGVVLRLVE